MPGLKPRPTSEATAKTTATARAKYRDLSTAAAEAPPSVEMTFVVASSSRQSETRTTNATAYSGDVTVKAMTQGLAAPI